MSRKSYDPYDLGYEAGRATERQKYGHLEAVAASVVRWLSNNNLGGTAHARGLASALEELQEEIQGAVIVESLKPQLRRNKNECDLSRGATTLLRALCNDELKRADDILSKTSKNSHPAILRARTETLDSARELAKWAMSQSHP